jgi:hypothetical protein
MPKRTNPLFYRWCDAMRQRVPQIPEELLTLYYEALEAGSSVSVDAIAEALHGDAAAAAYWYHEALVWLLDPALYTPLFAAEDDMADCRSKRTAFVLSAKQTDDRLAVLDEAITKTKIYGLLSPTHEAEVAPQIVVLDEERLTLLRHKERDLPAMRELLEAEERTVLDRLQDAQAAIDNAFSQQVDTIQQAWLQEALERCEPILEVLRRARTLDEAAKALGRQEYLSGSLAVHQAVVHRLQGER